MNKQTKEPDILFTQTDSETAVSDEELVKAIRSGDASAEETLYNRYKPIVRSRARTYFLVGADREDVIQEGMIGLYKAVCDFEQDRQISFRAFADVCITRQIITAIERATRKKHAPLNNYISIHRPAYDENSDNSLLLEDVLEASRLYDPEEMVISREKYESVMYLIQNSLTKLEKQVLTLYLNGLSYQQIAETLDRSPKCVDNAIQRIKKKLEERQKD